MPTAISRLCLDWIETNRRKLLDLNEFYPIDSK